MKTITIKRATNGYMANHAPSPEDPLGQAVNDPFVFGTFNNLVSWLREQFNEPTGFSLMTKPNERNHAHIDPWNKC